MMEIERLKKIKFYEEQEKFKKDEQKKGHVEIIRQIKERDLVRLRDREEQEIEGQIMLREIKKMQEEEAVDSIVFQNDLKIESKTQSKGPSRPNLRCQSKSHPCEGEGEGY